MNFFLNEVVMCKDRVAFLVCHFSRNPTCCGIVSAQTHSDKIAACDQLTNEKRPHDGHTIAKRPQMIKLGLGSFISLP